MVRSRRTVAVLALSFMPGLVAGTSPSLAQVPAQSPDQAPASAPDVRVDPRLMAEGLAAAGRPDLAYRVLSDTYGSNASDADVQLQMARLARAAGYNDLALSHYHALIAAHPGATEVQAELGGFYAALGRPDDARRQWALAGMVTDDADVATLLSNVSRELPIGDPARLAAAEKPWSVELFSGVVFDSNVNVGPNSSTIAAVIGGTPITLILSQDSEPREAWGWTNSVNGSYLVPLSNRFALLGQGSFGMTNYFGKSEFDTHSFAGGLGLIYRENGVTASLQPNARMILRDRDTDEVDYALNGRVTVALGGEWRGTASLGAAHRDVPENEGRDGEVYQGGAGLGYTFENGLDLGFEYLLLRDEAEEGIFANTRHGPLVYINLPLSETVVFSANYRFSHVEYDDRQVLFAETRSDNQHDIGFNFGWDISQWTVPGLSLRSQYTYSKGYSTLDMNDYVRHTVLTGVALRF